MSAQDLSHAIGANVRAARKRAALSRKRLAAVAGVSERYLSQLEQGEANVSIGILTKVAAALDVELLGLLPSTGHALSDRHPTTGHAALAALIATMSPREQEAAVGVLQRFLDERRKAANGIALLGLRGAGKTTIGGLLATRLGMPFVSVTREIEARAGMPLSDLFNLGGPDAYRALENAVVRDLVDRRTPVVLETAGGIVSNSEALDVILGAFRTIWLKASPEEHLRRVVRQGDMRPIQGDPKALEHVKALLAAREPEYARADHVLDTSGRGVEDCLAEIERLAGAFVRAA